LQDAFRLVSVRVKRRGMESPGACIRRERELRGFSVQDVHRATRIPVKILRALEADDYGSLPQPAFVKGYLKACCKFMGLDETDLILRYELYLKENAPRVEEPEAEKDRGSKPGPSLALDSNKVVGLLLVIGILIIVISYFLGRKGADEVLVKKHGEEVQTTGKAQEGQGPRERAGGALPGPVGPVSEQHPLALGPAPEEEAETAPGHVLKVMATDDVWIRFTIDDRKPFEVLFRKGDDRHWLMKRGVSLVIGNAAGATIVFDGRPVDLPREQGRVIRLNLPGTWKGQKKAHLHRRSKVHVSGHAGLPGAPLQSSAPAHEPPDDKEKKGLLQGGASHQAPPPSAEVETGTQGGLGRARDDEARGGKGVTGPVSFPGQGSGIGGVEEGQQGGGEVPDRSIGQDQEGDSAGVSPKDSKGSTKGTTKDIGINKDRAMGRDNGREKRGTGALEEGAGNGRMGAFEPSEKETPPGGGVGGQGPTPAGGDEAGDVSPSPEEARPETSPGPPDEGPVKKKSRKPEPDPWADDYI